MGLPISRVMVRAMSSAWAVMRSHHLRRMRERSVPGVAFQAGNASPADSSARRPSSARQSATSASVSPVAGLRTGNVRAALRHSPATKAWRGQDGRSLISHPSRARISAGGRKRRSAPVGVAPDDEHAVVRARGVLEVVRAQPVHVIPAVELHGESRIVQLPAHHARHVGLDGHGLAMTVVTVRHRALDVTGEAQAAAQALALLVKEGREAAAAEVGMHSDVRAIEPVARGLVVRQPVAGDGVDVAMLVVVKVDRGPEVGGSGDHPARRRLDHGVLPFREHEDVGAIVLGAHPLARAEGGEARLLDGGQLVRHPLFRADHRDAPVFGHATWYDRHAIIWRITGPGHSRVVRVAVVLGLAMLAAPPVARAQAAPPAPTPGISDNSFLLAEAYNQEFGVVQHISALSRCGPSDWIYTFTQEWPGPA